MPSSRTIISPRGFDVYMIQFCLAYYLNLLQIVEKQTKSKVAQKRWSRQTLVYSILKTALTTKRNYRVYDLNHSCTYKLQVGSPLTEKVTSSQRKLNIRSSFLSLIQSVRYKMVVQMNGPYSVSYFFILLFKTQFIASKLQLYIPESISLLNCQCNVS